MNPKIKALILANESKIDHNEWVISCNKYKEEIDFFVINLTKENWLSEVSRVKPDILLTKPGGKTLQFKLLYDERLSVLVKELKYKSYPSLDEVLIYENKRYFTYWLMANMLPHPNTFISYYKTEAMDFIETTNYPIVAKLNIGASGNGVNIIKSKEEAIKYTNLIFSGGVRSRVGPKLNKGKLLRRLLNKIKSPVAFTDKIKTYRDVSRDFQKGFLLFQEYIPHDYEWRAVRIGDSFFAHKKMKKGEKTSGSLLKGYENPPISLLNFVKDVTDRFGFYSQAVDVFEVSNHKYLINEMQCIFGQSDTYQMKVDNKIGRYIFENEQWMFQEGVFNSNKSYDLRIEAVIKNYKKIYK